MCSLKESPGLLHLRIDTPARVSRNIRPQTGIGIGKRRHIRPLDYAATVIRTGSVAVIGAEVVTVAAGARVRHDVAALQLRLWSAVCAEGDAVRPESQDTILPRHQVETRDSGCLELRLRRGRNGCRAFIADHLRQEHRHIAGDRRAVASGATGGADCSVGCGYGDVVDAVQKAISRGGCFCLDCVVGSPVCSCGDCRGVGGVLHRTLGEIPIGDFNA